MQTKAFLPPSPDFTFKKSERLCSRKAFDFLFAQGKSIFSHPVKLVYSIEKSSESRVQVAFGVSKKNYKRAVKRNKIKRCLREIYRTHKFDVHEGKSINIMFIYISKEILPYQELETALMKGLKELAARVEKNS